MSEDNTNNIYFIDKYNQNKSKVMVDSNANQDSKLISFEEETILINSYKNIGYLMNMMMNNCSLNCIKEMSLKELTRNEENCLENCYNKYLQSFVATNMRFSELSQNKNPI